MKKQCLECQKQYRIYPCEVKRNKFCSRKCQNVYWGKNHRGNKSIVWKGGLNSPGKAKINCRACNKTFVIPRCRIKTKKYCSVICYRKITIARYLKQRKQFVCQECGVIFYNKPSKKYLYCSRQCRAIGVGRKLSGENSPHWKGGIPKCVNCGKQLKSYRAKNCVDCFLKYVTKEAWHIKPTKPEKIMDKFLNRNFPNKWKYVGDGQIWIGRKNPDFLNINGEKKLIEVYGDYWHKGKDPKERIEHFKKFGFETVVIWEHEIENPKRLRKIIENNFYSKRVKGVD